METVANVGLAQSSDFNLCCFSNDRIALFCCLFSLLVQARVHLWDRLRVLVFSPAFNHLILRAHVMVSTIHSSTLRQNALFTCTQKLHSTTSRYLT